MKSDDRQKPVADPRRRSFLLTTSLGSAGAVAAMVAARSPVTPEAEPAEPAHASRGYRVSEHILNYYRSTRI